jgi:histidine triad (HIT) family protein
MDPNCLFCKIIRGDIPAKKLYEDDEVLAFWDISPQAPTHFLVIPKRHIAGPAAMGSEDEQLIGKVMRIGARLASENNIGDGFRIVFNNGGDAGQTVFHIHMHILGGRRMNWPPG